MPVVGSPEWFHEKSQTKDMQNWMRTVEEKREIFRDRFSPEKLMAMTGSELLLNVFGNDPSSMMRLLMFDREYRWFGASGTYAYLGIVFYDGENWKYNEKNNYTTLSLSQAEEKADNVRDQIIYCVDEIKNYGIFKTVQDYKKLQERLENKVFFYQYQWAMKYYQMLFPQYFPGMYVDKGFLARACYILGLPDHGNRFLNAGQVSLFIQTCDINNIVFNRIYSTEWGWSGDVRPCPNATVNYENSFKPVETINLEYYRLSTRKEKMAEHAVQIEKEIENLGLKGQEREAVIKARVNQGIFRDLLLKRYHNCCLCRISDPQLLVAWLL